MEVPVFSATERSQLQLSPILAVGACVKGRLSGTLTVQTDKVVRQLKWSRGQCVGALSNAKSELPGSFLYAEKKLTKDQYDAYVAEIRTPKPDFWGLALKSLSLSETELAKLQAAYTARLVRELTNAPASTVQFLPAATDVERPWTQGLRALIDGFAEVPAGKLKDLVTDLLPANSIFLETAQEKILAPLPVSAEENGLLTVIRNNEIVSEVYSSSFLGADRITRLLAAFWLAGLVRLESADAALRKKHEAGLTPENRATIDELRRRAESLDRTTYYQWLGAEPGAKVEKIRELFQREIERLTSPELPKLFLGDEKKLPEKLLGGLKEALAILSNPAQRKEYDLFIASGGSGSFANLSVVKREEELLANAARLKQAGATQALIDLLKKGVEDLPQSVSLVAAFARGVLEAGLSADPKLRDDVLSHLKRALEIKPPAAEVFEALGAWMESAEQKAKALEAYKRAAGIAPFSKRANEGLHRLAPAQANALIVQAIHRSLSRMNHYDLLGLTPRASAKEIQTAYRDCTKRFHPDRFFNVEDPAIKATANEIYKAMVRAYTTLKSATKRAEYDGQAQRPGLSASEAASPETPGQDVENLATPKHPQAKRFLDLALQAIRQGKKDTAKLNLQLGLQIEPQNGLLQAKLKEIS